MNSAAVRNTFADLKKICIIGPECTGKTTLSQALSEYYKTAWVPEYARGYLDNLNRPYEKIDLLKIAHGQIRLEEEWMREANRLIFFDTNLLVIKIWSEHKFGDCEPEIIRQHKARTYDHYLLTDTDLPWEDDPQREHPELRGHFKKLYTDLIHQSEVPYNILSGTKENRLLNAIRIIDRILSPLS
ncbi:MAG: AAA family ATPase [Cyclobacteriaceae bacterium]